MPAYTDNQGETAEDRKAAAKKERSRMQAPPEVRAQLAKEEEALDAVTPVAASVDAAVLRNMSRKLKEAANAGLYDPEADLAEDVAKIAKGMKASGDKSLSEVSDLLTDHVKRGKKDYLARKKERLQDAESAGFDLEGAVSRTAQRLEQMANQALAAQQAAAVAAPAKSFPREYGTQDPV